MLLPKLSYSPSLLAFAVQNIFFQALLRLNFTVEDVPFFGQKTFFCLPAGLCITSTMLLLIYAPWYHCL